MSNGNVPPNLPSIPSEPEPQEPPPPQSLGPIPAPSQSSRPEPNAASAPSVNVPERVFPKAAMEKLPDANVSKDQFNVPSDIVPKRPSVTPAAKSFEVPKESAKPNETDLSTFMPEEGLTPEEVERRESIKKVLAFSVVFILVILAVVYLVNKFILAPKKNTTEQQSKSIITITPIQTTVSTAIPTPANQDSDNDGLLDEWETKYKLNKDDAGDAKLDNDLDGLTNLEEYKYGTDPRNADTDNDGYNDGAEVEKGYNPNGAGKLEEQVNNNQLNTDQKTLSILKGVWKGVLVGKFYSIKDLELKLTEDGKMTGTFSTTYQGRIINAEFAGTFDYNKGSKLFAASGEGTMQYQAKTSSYQKTTVPTSGEYSIALNGKEDGVVSGTWTLTPKTTGVSWLVNDRGNFKVQK